jgi:hypothetical protein
MLQPGSRPGCGLKLVASDYSTVRRCPLQLQPDFGRAEDFLAASIGIPVPECIAEMSEMRKAVTLDGRGNYRF